MNGSSGLSCFITNISSTDTVMVSPLGDVIRYPGLPRYGVILTQWGGTFHSSTGRSYSSRSTSMKLSPTSIRYISLSRHMAELVIS